MTSIVPIVGINYLKECRIFNMNYLLLSSSLFSLSKAASPDFFLTSVAKKLKLKHKTQAKISRKKLNLREAVSSGQEKLKEKTQF